MKSNIVKLIAAGLLLPVGFTGCATVDSIGGVSTTDREKKAIQEARVVGTVGGAALGGLLVGGLAAASGVRDNRQLAAYIAAGAVAGGVAGHQVGTNKGVQMVQNHRGERFRVDQLRAMISGAYDYNRQAEAYNQRLRQRVNAVQQSKSKSEAEAALSEAQRNRNAMAARIQERNETARNLPSAYSSSYLASNQGLEAQKRATDSMLAKLRSISQAE